ncbi:MAG: ABC transporter substrate-binding protein [Cytophagales bacterium]|nr:ABC transporter substrate-binding protein [Bernardetiaceae bacterium]MDW8209998.1 ABC transporter substrate-binding protein [Cytophagales bacterium]
MGDKLLILAVCSLLGCSPKQPNQISNELRQAAGGRYYGGILRINENEYIKTLFPPAIVDVYSYRVASQIYEGLFKFDQVTMEVIQSLVQSYEVDPTQTIYTFKLKPNVYFHDDPAFPNGKGREFTAEDVKFCFTQICTQIPENQSFHLFDGILKGAREYYQASAGGKKPSFEVEGIKVIDKYTVQLILERPYSLLLSNLARSGALIYPREAYEKYGSEMKFKAVGTGPFVLANIDENNSITLKRNPNYHRRDQFGNQLPLLDGVFIQFIREKRTEFFEFKKGNLDMMYRLPTEYIIEILEQAETDPDGGISKYTLQREPETQTQLYAFLNTHPVFKNINVRKAFSFAIDRKEILDRVLNGEGYEAGLHGITPPSFRWYDIHKIKGYDFNKDSALYYIAKAGYPMGKNFPKITLDLNPEGERHTLVATEIQRQLKEVLNIDIELNVITHAEITDKCLSGDFAMIRLSWVADFPSPENFLWMFYSKKSEFKPGENTYPNIPRYYNPKFNQYYEKALAATSLEEQTKYFQAAESIMMEDAPIIVLWYDECYRLLQQHVENLPNNPMQYRDFSEVYLKPKKTEPKQEQVQ